jgi:hypothetical protein
MLWYEQVAEAVYSDFVTTQLHATPYGDLKVQTAQIKPEFSGAALWKAYQARGLTVPLLDYVASTCQAARSPSCWQMLGIMFDKGIRPPRDFLNRFFGNSPIGYSFTIHPDFPEDAAGLDRMLALGASINATDAQGKTVLARLMQMNVNPKTLQFLIQRGAQLQTAPAVTGTVPAAPTPKPR